MKKINPIIFILLITFAIFFFYKTSEANKNFDSESFIKTSNDYSYNINRDKYGVPHITGIKDKDAAFGFGFAQTEDDYENIEFVIKMARGELSDFNVSPDSLISLFNLISGSGDIMENISAIDGVELDFLIKFLNTEDTALR